MTAAFLLALVLAPLLAAQSVTPPNPAPPEPGNAPQPQTQRTSLNLLGRTDANSGESRRNENIQFNLIDTATAKELMVRLGTSATVHSEFHADRSYSAASSAPGPRRSSTCRRRKARAFTDRLSRRT
jgi:hypothetical protein